MKHVIINGHSFNLASNAKKTEQEFVDRWTPLAFLNERANRREELLREAYGLILKSVAPKEVEKEPEDLVPDVLDGDKPEDTISDEPVEAKPSYKLKGRR